MIALLCAVNLAAPASAETYNVLLGAKNLGRLSYAERGPKATLRSTLNSTPMGVFNGTFVGTSIGSPTSSRFTGDSKSSRKQRVVSVEITKSRAARTEITPTDELTVLSDVSRVPAGVTDPVRAIGALIRWSKGCPPPLKMYDGRRVVALTPSSSGKQLGDTLVCTISYKVVAGPGHLSPLGISNAKIELQYAVTGGQQSLHAMKISSGIFRLSLDRTD